MDNDITLVKVSDPSLPTLLRQFEPGPLSRGTSYARQHRVNGLEVGDDPHAHPGWTIDAEVRGSEGNAYAVEIDLARDETGQWFFGGQCTCPVGWRCKHMVAVLTVLAQTRRDVIPAVTAPQGVTERGAAGHPGPRPHISAPPAPPTAPPPQPGPPPSPQEKAAVAWLRKLQQDALLAARASHPAPAPEFIFFVLSDDADIAHPGQRQLSLVPARARRLKATGRPGVLQMLNERSHSAFTDHAHDGALNTLREQLNTMTRMGSGWHPVAWGRLHGPLAPLTLQQALASGRVVTATEDGTPSEPWRWGDPLRLGWRWIESPATAGTARAKARSATPGPATDPLWQLRAQVQRMDDQPVEATPLIGQPSWYRDDARRVVGLLELGRDSLRQVQQWLTAPPLPEYWLRAQQNQLRQHLPRLPEAVATPAARIIHHSPPRPVLRLLGQSSADSPIRFELQFDYAGQRCGPWPAGAAVRQFIDSPAGLVELHRDPAVELQCVHPWMALAHPDPDAPLTNPSEQPARRWCLGPAQPGKRDPHPAVQLTAWLAQDFAPLREMGFDVALAPDWQAQVRQVEHLDAELTLPEGAEPGWLDLSVGFELDGQRLDLLPLLPQVLANLPADADAARLPERLWLQHEDGQWLSLASAPLQPWLAVLLELLGERDFSAGRLQLSPLDALRLGADQAAFGHDGHTALREVLAPRQPDTVLPALPPGLQATPRPYQHQGYAWLGALAKHHLGGVLADDMGLGKTLQTLMHLQAEHAGSAAAHPSLVVAPTSLVGNWRRECQRFTPGLRLLVLHGSERHALHTELARHDVVLTTYPLLQRDVDVLAQQPWHALILDEAQALKNVGTQTAQAARQLQAHHRIALSGTPMENHLGELWSLMDLVLPGYLGRLKRFTELFRNPIEKQGDGPRLALLRRRLAPFMLRRDKSMVAAELPPKIEQLVRVSLDAHQANLYETIRAAAETTVQQALAKQGLARSHITVLDALLKLRQVCCHPQLLKLPAARKVKHSAKLEWLLENLPQMLEEGRRVLLFSQFTSMLALIEDALRPTGLRWTLLTGDTTDREAAIARFTSGEVPLFLISLKAGGTGLNLPQADTVIHYDPWWNPAVENQATDRAHRLGQTQTVFVYKLVAEGTLEERILAMQARKAALAQGVQGQGDGGLASSRLSAADLDWLLQPLAQVAESVEATTTATTEDPSFLNLPTEMNDAH